MTRNISARLTALEQAKPKATNAWVRLIVPEEMTKAQGEALVAAERNKLPPGTGIIVRWII
ncbi:hypothetical protein [Rhodovarius sp.]|uniref:hypothetical protein n=1 Tax=Rhodovarius sp. TaxID=2972673 RepID=UPI00333E75FB